MSDQKKTILVVDEDEAVRASLRVLLEIEGYAVRDYGSGTAFLEDAKDLELACILLALRLPDMDGFTVLSVLHKREIRTPVIVLTGTGNARIEEHLLQHGVLCMLDKPVEIDDLLDALKLAFPAS